MKTTWRSVWRLVFSRVPGVLGIVGLLPWVSVRLAAQAVEEESPMIVLPTYEVEDLLPLPDAEAWRYTRLSGFEILSNASDATTQRLMQRFQDFAFALNLVWPVKVEWPVPVKIIICGRPRSFGTLVPAAARNAPTWMASVDEDAVIVIDAVSRELAIPVGERLYWADEDLDDLQEEGPGRRMRLDTSINLDRHLAREFVRYVFSRADGPVPPWLEEGVAQLAMKMNVGSRRIEFGLLEPPRVEPNVHDIMPMSQVGQFQDGASMSGFSPRVLLDGASNPANITISRPVVISQRVLSMYPGKFMPFDEMFAAQYGSPGTQGGVAGPWARQCELFVHYCLYGWKKKKFQPALLALVDRAAQGPVNESVFQECFGFGYKRLNMLLRGHANFPDQHPYQGNLRHGQVLPKAQPVDFRNATDAEVARIKAAALDLAGGSPTARMELINAYRRGERDPELLASLGLLEVREDRKERGRVFLEMAVRQMATKNPRAYLALARLWFDDAMAVPNGVDGALGRRQVAGVLRWLFEARDLQPKLPGVYEQIASVWQHSEAAPTRDNLAVLSEGVGLFPRNRALILSAAELNLRHGFTDTAAALAEHGLKLKLDDRDRSRLEAIRDRAGASQPLPTSGASAPEAILTPAGG